jgi:flagellar biosynthesis/type III secretory pathway protein FliH
MAGWWGSEVPRFFPQTKILGADTAYVPGVLHQGIISIAKDDPWLAHDLLGLERPVDGTPIDRANTLDRDSGRPWQVNPIYPDLVLIFQDPADPTHGIVLCLEAQRKPAPEKRWQISLYQAALAWEHELDVEVVVVSFSRAFSRLVRSWAHSSPKIEALVLDADNVPPMTLEQARARPTAAVLAAALHGVRGNIEVARIAIAAILELPEKQRDRYANTILAALPVRQRAIVRKELPVKQRDELWEIEKRSGTYHEGRKTGRKEGREKGREEGRKAGREEGREEGRREAANRYLVEMILAMLEVRGIAVDAASKSRIQTEKRTSTLERWASAAREVEHVTELFELR